MMDLLDLWYYSIKQSYMWKYKQFYKNFHEKLFFFFFQTV